MSYHIIPYHTRTSNSVPHGQTHARRLAWRSVASRSTADSYRRFKAASKLKTAREQEVSLARASSRHCQNVTALPEHWSFCPFVLMDLLGMCAVLRLDVDRTKLLNVIVMQDGYKTV